MRDKFPLQLLNFLLRSSCSMRFGVILLKEYPFSIDEFRKTLTQNGMRPFELSRIKLSIDCAPIRDQLKVNYAGEIPPNTEHNLFYRTVLFLVLKVPVDLGPTITFAD